MEQELRRYNQLHKKYDALDGFEFDRNDLKNSEASYAYNTCGIEGNTFSLGETETFLRSGQVIKGHSLKEHNEIKGAQKAFNIVFNLASDKKPVSEKMALFIHKKVMEYVEPEKAGQYKNTSNRVDGFSTPCPAKAKIMFPQAIESFLKDIKTKHPMIAGGELHLNTLMIHPFLDDNGRTSRLLHNYALISRGHSQLQYLVKDRENYIQAIRDTRNQKDPDILLEYSLSIANQSLEKKLEYVVGKKSPTSGDSLYEWLNALEKVEFYD